MKIENITEAMRLLKEQPDKTRYEDEYCIIKSRNGNPTCIEFKEKARDFINNLCDSPFNPNRNVECTKFMGMDIVKAKECPRCKSTNTFTYPFEADSEEDDLICKDCGYGTLIKMKEKELPVTNCPLKKETSLSSKEVLTDGHERIYNAWDIREAVRRLKEELCEEAMKNPQMHWASMDRIPQRDIIESIDEIFGDELTKEVDDES